MNVRKVSGSIAICALLLGVQNSRSESQQSSKTVMTAVSPSDDSRGAQVSVDNTAVLKKESKPSRPVQPKLKNPHVVEKTDQGLDTGRVRKQSVPDCNYFGGMQTCEIRAIAEINPNSPNSINPGGVVQGAGNLIDFKLGNKAASPGNLVGPLHGFFEVPSTWTITGWTTGTNWTCSGTAPVSGGAALPGSSFWGIYAAQADPPFNANQNNSVRCVYNGPKLAPGDVTATAVTFTVTVPVSPTRWSSFFGASSEFLIGGQNGAVENNYQVINYMTLRYDINGGTGTTPGSELYNTAITQGNRTAASDSGFSKAGFTFGGWSCDNSIGTKQPGQSISWSNADVLCTAIWTPPAFQLSYSAGAGSGTVPTTVTGLNSGSTPTLAAGSGVTPPANQTFTGWNCDNSIGAKSAGANVTMPAANVICTAQFTPNTPSPSPAQTFQLSYSAGAGSGTVPTTVTGLNSGSTPTLAAGSGVTPPANQTFTGWNCDNSIGAKSAGANVTMPAANVICTAQFAPNTPSPSPASVDVKDATNDSSVGRKGARQILEPLGNDVLFNSSRWTPSSMRLCGPQQSAPNCTRRTLAVDGEGTYVIDSTGRVTFTPEPDFVGKATRVKYQVTNSAGRVVAANIRITVSGQGLPNSGNKSQTIFLLALLLISLGSIMKLGQRFRM